MEEEEPELFENEIDQMNEDTNMGQSAVESQQVNTNFSGSKDTNTKAETRYKMPSKFYQAKREIDAIVQGYFGALKTEYLKRNTTQKPEVNINAKYANDIKRNLRNYLNLFAPKNIIISQPDTKSPIYVYCPQDQTLLQCIGENSIKKKPINGKQLPSMGTPIHFSDYVFIVDGSSFCPKKKDFTQSPHPIRISLRTGAVQFLDPPNNLKMKGAVIKHQQYIYLISGYVTQKKYKTSSCQKLNLKTLKWETISSLNNTYGICTASLFNNEIYLFAKEGIQRFRQQQWQILKMPYNLSIPSFSFICQINPKDILILGGWEGTTRLDEMYLYDPEENICRIGGSSLPCSVSSQKVSGCMIKSGKLFVLSPICYSVDRQFGYKKGAYQLIVVSESSSLKTINIA